MITYYHYCNEQGFGIVFLGQDDFKIVADYLCPDRNIFRSDDETYEEYQAACEKVQNNYRNHSALKELAEDEYEHFKLGVQSLIALYAASDGIRFDVDHFASLWNAANGNQEMLDVFDHAARYECDSIVCDVHEDEDGLEYAYLEFTARKHGGPYWTSRLYLKHFFESKDTRKDD